MWCFLLNGSAAIATMLELPLPLLVVRVLAYDEHATVTSNDATLVAHRFYRRSDLHLDPPWALGINYILRAQGEALVLVFIPELLSSMHAHIYKPPLAANSDCIRIGRALRKRFARRDLSPGPGKN